MLGENQIVLTVYTVIGDYSRVRESLIRQLAEVTEEVVLNQQGADGVDKLTLRLQDDTLMECSVNHNEQFLQEHIEGMGNYFAKAPCENAGLKENVLRQIAVFNCVAGCIFESSEDKDRTNYLISSVLATAEELNGLLLLPSMSLHNGQGQLVLSIQGRTDLEEYHPVGNSDFLDQGPAESEADIQRRMRSIVQLEKRGIPYLEKLRAPVMEEEAVTRSPVEIAQRLCAIFSLCVYCEALREQPREEALGYVDAMDDLLDGALRDYMTPEETAFLAAEAPSQEDIVTFSWRYECCHVLLWALGYLEDLGYPGAPCDVAAMARIMWNITGMTDFLEGAFPRAQEEILDTADLVLRYRWACVDAQVHGKNNPAGLDGGVLYEWQYALHWLIGANGNAGWDDIVPNT